MVGYDGRGANFPLTIPRGSDVAFTVTATTDAGAAIDLSAATITGNIYTSAGTVAVAMADAVGGAGNNVITLSLSDTQTTALTATAYRWALIVTRGTDTRYWLAGAVTMVDVSAGRTSNGANATLVVDEDINIAVSVAAIGGTGGAGTIRIEDEGVSTVAAATAINFAGAGVTVTDAGSDEALVTISSGGSGANLAWVAASSQVTSDSGTDATLTVVDGSNPGLMTVADKSKLDGIEAGADVTDTTNVTSAGALMDSEVDADLKTLSLPANTTISVYGASLIDDADAATARTTLGLGNAATLTVDADLASFAVPASTTISTFGASLVDDIDASTARTTLGLAIGTNVQAYDADLADIAAISDVQGDIIVRGASGWERLAKSATSTDVLTAGASQPAWAAAPSGGAIRIEDEGVSTVAAATAINFAGAGVAVTDAGSNEALVTISGGGSSDPLDGNVQIANRVFAR